MGHNFRAVGRDKAPVSALTGLLRRTTAWLAGASGPVVPSPPARAPRIDTQAKRHASPTPRVPSFVWQPPVDKLTLASADGQERLARWSRGGIKIIPWLDIGCENDMLAVARTLVQHNPEAAAEQLDDFAAQDDATRDALAQIVFDAHPQALARNLWRLAIDDDVLRTAWSMRCAEQFPTETYLALPRLELPNETDRLKVTLAAVASASHLVSDRLESAAITSPDAMLKVARALAARPRGEMRVAAFNMGQGAPQPFADYVLDALALAMGPIEVMNALGAAEPLSDLPYEVAREHLTAFADTSPQRLNPRMLERVLEASRHTPTVAGLLELATRCPDAPDVASLVERTSGLTLSGKPSREALAETYALLVELQLASQVPVFGACSLDASLTADKRLEGLRDYLRVARDLGALDRDALGALQGEVTREALRVHTRELRERLVTRVADVLESGASTAARLDRLREQWGDTETLMTLAARYNGRADWRACNPLLGRVMTAVTDGAFTSFKFEGDAERSDDVAAARAQLAMLGEKAKLAWQRERCMARLDTAGEASDEATREAKLVARVSLEARTTFVAHAPQTAAGRDVTALLSTHGEPAAALETVDLPADVLLAALARAVSKARTLGEMRRGVTLAQVHLNRHRGLLDPTTEQQLRNDLTSLAVALRPAHHERRSGAVVTVATHHPKIALEVGDLVRAASCQSYRTGSLIQSLLGYVVDANVRVMASFAVDASSFMSAADARAVFDAMARGEVPATFDGGRRTVTFDLGPRTITTRPLGAAYRRQMLKLGVSDMGKPALTLERPYVTTHTAGDLMERAHEAMLRAIAVDVGAKTNVAVNVVGSRAPYGVYSDAAQGIQVGDYRID